MPAALHPQAPCGSQSTFTGDASETLRPGEKRKGRRQEWLGYAQVKAAARSGLDPQVRDLTAGQWPPPPGWPVWDMGRPHSSAPTPWVGEAPRLLLAARRRRPTPPPPSNLCRRTHSGLFFPALPNTQSLLLQTVRVGILRTANDFVNTSQKNKQC